MEVLPNEVLCIIIAKSNNKKNINLTCRLFHKLVVNIGFNKITITNKNVKSKIWKYVNLNTDLYLSYLSTNYWPLIPKEVNCNLFHINMLIRDNNEYEDLDPDIIVHDYQKWSPTLKNLEMEYLFSKINPKKLDFKELTFDCQYLPDNIEEIDLSESIIINFDGKKLSNCVVINFGSFCGDLTDNDFKYLSKCEHLNLTYVDCGLTDKLFNYLINLKSLTFIIDLFTGSNFDKLINLETIVLHTPNSNNIIFNFDNLLKLPKLQKIKVNHKYLDYISEDLYKIVEFI